MEKTYEMLWDCEYCGTKKLLGKTHRHCPECGAAQDADRRYFPEEPEKVAVEDHQFVGADRYCPACKAPNSATAKHCTECGSPMEEGVEVTGVEDNAALPEADHGARPKPKSSRVKWVVLAVALLVICGVAAALLWNKSLSLAVSGHAWQRAVAIERFGPVARSGWCDQMPRDAYGVTRVREVRSHKKIPDGQECRTKRIDNKDGTFKEKRECKTKYRKEPVYDDKCRYTVNRWQQTRTVKTAGRSLAETPVWPPVTLPKVSASVIGAERAGPRTESYTVQFTALDRTVHTCEFNETKWRSFGLSTQWTGESGVLTGALDCESLVPLRR